MASLQSEHAAVHGDAGSSLHATWKEVLRDEESMVVGCGLMVIMVRRREASILRQRSRDDRV